MYKFKGGIVHFRTQGRKVKTISMTLYMYLKRDPYWHHPSPAVSLYLNIRSVWHYGVSLLIPFSVESLIK